MDLDIVRRIQQHTTPHTMYIVYIWYALYIIVLCDSNQFKSGILYITYYVVKYIKQTETKKKPKTKTLLYIAFRAHN